MSHDPAQHHRRSIRLKGYDYTSEGVYFITICLEGRVHRFGTVVDDVVALSEVGRMIQQTWDEIPAAYTGIDVDAFVVMPDHIHGVIIIKHVGAGPRARPESISPSRRPQGVAPTDNVQAVGEGPVPAPIWPISLPLSTWAGIK